MTKNNSKKNHSPRDANGLPATHHGHIRPFYGVLFLISMAGMADAAYLAYVHLSASGACIAGTGCSAVLSSEYATVSGIPVAAVGMGMYLALAWFSGLIFRKPSLVLDYEPWVFGISLLGILASSVFTALQAVVIGQWCLFCLMSAGFTAVFFAMCLSSCMKTGSLRGVAMQPALIRRGLPAAVLAFILPPLLVMAADGAPVRSDGVEGASESRIVAVIGDRSYTLSEVDRAIQLQLQQIEMERYDERKTFLEKELIRFEASREGLTEAGLIERDVVQKIVVPKEEIRQFMEENRDRLPKEPASVLVKKIENLLRNRKIKDSKAAYINQLVERHHIRFDLPLPDRLQMEANPRGGPDTGPPDAPVTIVEFSDFECPYCSKTHVELKNLLRRYPGKIRLVFRHFPLNQHPKAKRAAEFAGCVHLQGQFWPFIDLLFSNQHALAEPQLNDYARTLDLDTEALTQCLQAGAGRSAVDQDLADGRGWGLKSTPSLFINGLHFSGLPKNLDAIIKGELAAAGAAKSTEP